MNIGMRYIVTFIFVIAVLSGAYAGPVDDFRMSAGIDPSSSAVIVRDLSSGETAVSYNGDLPLIPASIMKCVTVATLLSRKDVEDRYHTRVYLTGPVDDGVAEGNILIEGSGDPSLNSRYIKGVPDICEEIADALAANGIGEVRGRIVFDESVWDGPAVPPSWMSADLPHAYGTGSHGVNFEDNASGNRSVSDPAAVFSGRLRAVLERRGITVSGESIPEGKRRELVDHQSAPLDEIMRSCMMRSDNQYAEAMLRTYGVASGKKGATSPSALLETDYWRRMEAPMRGVKIVDGSGLSRENRVTAEFMASVLASRSDDPYYASFFPLAGQEGTLRNFLSGTPLDGYVAMKTGSMRGIQCYAGYKLDDDYVPTHLVVVILNNMKNRGQAREAVGKLLLETFNPGYDSAETVSD